MRYIRIKIKSLSYFQHFQIKSEKYDFFNFIYTNKTYMKKRYIIEIIEPNTKIKIGKNWKQKCNFYIELVQIKIIDNYGRKTSK
jgi:hypothetical protein